MTQAMTPLVSIVTPVLNGARFLPECLASVRAQDHPRVEHIVVDGGSTDGTVDLLSRAPGIAWVSERDTGMYDAINRGFRMAKGEILAYQNADDRYLPDAVSAAVAHFAAHPEVDVVYGDFRYVAEDGRAVEGRTGKARAFDRRALLRYNFIPPHSTFVRRRVVIDDGHWLDPTLHFPGDWDWFVRMALAGKSFAHVDRILSEFRLHPRSKTTTFGWLPKLREWRRICRKNQTSLALLVWYETLYVPLRKRLGLPA